MVAPSGVPDGGDCTPIMHRTEDGVEGGRSTPLCSREALHDRCADQGLEPPTDDRKASMVVLLADAKDGRD